MHRKNETYILNRDRENRVFNHIQIIEQLCEINIQASHNFCSNLGGVNSNQSKFDVEIIVS